MQQLRNLFCKYRHIVIGLAVLQFLYVGVESIGNVWIPKYLNNTFSGQVSVSEAGFILSFFWAAMTLGRWISGSVSRIFPPFKILMVLTLLALVGLTLAPGVSQLRGAKISFILLGFGLSGIFPFILANTERVQKILLAHSLPSL